MDGCCLISTFAGGWRSIAKTVGTFSSIVVISRFDVSVMSHQFTYIINRTATVPQFLWNCMVFWFQTCSTSDFHVEPDDGAE